MWGACGGESERRTERTPAQTFLGALAPRPSPVTTAPPGMIERDALVGGGGRPVRGEGGEERGGFREEERVHLLYSPGQAQVAAEGERAREIKKHHLPTRRPPAPRPPRPFLRWISPIGPTSLVFEFSHSPAPQPVLVPGQRASVHPQTMRMGVWPLNSVWAGILSIEEV